VAAWQWQRGSGLNSGSLADWLEQWQWQSLAVTVAMAVAATFNHQQQKKKHAQSQGSQIKFFA
jgi:hypothetical protein